MNRKIFRILAATTLVQVFLISASLISNTGVAYALSNQHSGSDDVSLRQQKHQLIIDLLSSLKTDGNRPSGYRSHRPAFSLDDKDDQFDMTNNLHNAPTRLVDGVDESLSSKTVVSPAAAAAAVNSLNEAKRFYSDWKRR